MSSYMTGKWVQLGAPNDIDEIPRVQRTRSAITVCICT